MAYRTLLAFLLISLLPGNSMSQTVLPGSDADSLARSDAEKLARTQLMDRGEVFFSFPVPAGASGAEFLAGMSAEGVFAGLSLDRLQNDSVYAYAGERGFDRFLRSGIPYRVLIPPGMATPDLRMAGPADLADKDMVESWDFYPTYDAYVQMMSGFERDFPELCQVISIGQSVLGRELLFARISSPEAPPGSVPRFMYTSTMHGDETAGFVLSLRLIHYLLSQYGKDDEITSLLRETEIWICPNENPDGTYRNDDGTIAGATRGNIRGVDLNRNYPNPVMDPVEEIQPETQAMIQFADTMAFTLSANMHGGIELVNYPFDSWLSSVNRHADHQWWQFVMQEFVDTVHHYSPPGYMTGLGSGLTHGGDWYVVYGSRQDYMNYYLSCREFTLELSNQKIPPASLLPELWENNHRSLLNYIRQAGFGLAGVVRDAGSGEVPDAVIRIPGHDKDNSEVNARARTGYFQRPLQQGVFDLEIEATGYPDMIFPALEVRHYETRWLDVSLGLLVFDPPEVEFGTVPAGDVARETLVIHNPGQQPVTADLRDIAGDGPFAFGMPAKQQVFTLLPGESLPVPLSFSPGAQGEYHGELLVGLDREPEALLRIPLLGTAAGDVTSVPEPPGTFVPVVYPNPFGSRMVVRIELPGPDRLMAGIYDLQGRRVHATAFFLPDAGMHELELSFGSDQLSPGMYILSLSTSSHTYRVNIVRIKSAP